MRNSPEPLAWNQNPSPFPALLGQHQQLREEKTKRSHTLRWHGHFVSLEKQLFLSLQRSGEASLERSKGGEAPETLLGEKEKGEGNCANGWERWEL